MKSSEFREPPLVIDLDGTLLRSDLSFETGLLFLRDQPHRFLAIFKWLLYGKATLKHELANATEIDVSILPYNLRVIAFIEQERKRGRYIMLVTASHRRLAEKVAAHHKVFDEVIATEGTHNVSARRKRDVLIRRFGERGYDYVGCSRRDLPVWANARHAYGVNASRAVEHKARAVGNFASISDSSKSGLRDYAKALRLHQWLKNLLVFIPLIASHQYTAYPLVLDALLAFLAFGFCASSVYILNDLLDLRDDRHHPRKKERPFAAGRLSILSGLIAFPLLLIAAFGLSLWLLPKAFSLGMAVYYLLTLAYSLYLKRRMVIDVITLATLYTLRIVVGAIALSISASFWLLALSMFMFLSLALVKRYAELFQVRTREGDKARGRGYFADDLPMVASLGAAAGYMAVGVLALYIDDAHTTQLYRHPQVIWLACPLLLIWISRVWMLAHRGNMHDDPVIFAARDRVSVSVFALMALVFWSAT